MNRTIAAYYQGLLESFSWLESPSGLVQPVTQRFGKVVKIFPVGCDVSWQDCEGNSEKYRALVPNSNKRSVSYFEDGPIGYFEDRGKGLYRSTIRLVVWMNLNRYEYSGCSVTNIAIAKILDAFKNRNPANYNGLTELRTTSLSVPKKDGIFSRYTYDEQKQFLFYPYDYFAIDIESSFAAPVACHSEIITKDADCTT
jgi:hypothetical protein